MHIDIKKDIIKTIIAIIGTEINGWKDNEFNPIYSFNLSITNI